MPKKIFIVEDDANVLASMQAKLSLGGLEVGSNSGNIKLEEIINEIRKFNPDYAIIDLMLPKVDGFKIIKALKENDETKNISIFVFTGLSDKESREKINTLGIKYFFLKQDFTFDEFVAKVIKIISNLDKINK